MFLAPTFMPRKPSDKTIKLKLDKLFSKMVREKNSCERCGSSSYLQCAHIYSRRYLNTRWDFDNALCLCSACHRWGHDKPIDFADFAIKVKGKDSIDRIRELAHKSTYSFKYQDKYEEFIEKYCKGSKVLL